jgi:hypothetical protein
MLTLPFLETMITQACNLSCYGCTNYSDLKHSGYVSWSEGKKQLSAWVDRINIEEFGIIGGEPLINPEWRDWVSGVRNLLPDARIRFTTNGLLLNKSPDILDFLESLNNVTFKITVHVDDAELEQSINQIFCSRDWIPVREFGIRRWQGPNGLRFQVNRPETFVKTYQGTYETMQPWHSVPSDAFAVCCQKTCPLLYRGKIYKCSTAGLLLDILDRFDNSNRSEWERYIDQGLDATASCGEIEKFISNFGQVNHICGQCPSVEHTTAKLLHKIQVRRK